MVQSNGKKKLFLYFIIFILLSTISNKSINNQDISFFVISNINVSGLSSKNNLKVKNDLSKILLKNIFLINKDSFIKILSKNNLIESFKIKKIYPNSIEIDLKETKLVGITNSNNKFFFIGSNGKLIKYENKHEELPFVFGKFNYIDFVKFKKIIDKSKFDFKEIDSIYFFPSNRWDIKTINGLLIKLPEKKILESLELANKIKKNIQFDNNKIIDLRISGRIIVSDE